MRRWLRGYGDAALAALLAAGFLVELGLAGTLSDRPASALLAVLATVALAYRRRAPLASFVVIWAAMLSLTWLVPGVGDAVLVFLIVFFVSLYSLGAYTRGPAAWVGGCLVAVGICIFVANDGDPFMPGDVLFGTGLVGGPWAAGLAIRLRRDREVDLASRADELERSREELARAAVTEERARIARELHDVVSHAISVTVLQARGGRRLLESDPSATREALDVIEHTNSQALSDMRRLLALLRDTDDGSPHNPPPSLAGLDALAGQLRASGLEVDVDVRGSPADVPPGVDLSAYRIVQESLTNVLKHSSGARAEVSVRYGDDEVEVSISSNGTAGAPERSGTGQGLIGMRERVAVVGGQLEAGPTPDGSFLVRARLPYEVG
jgi:signal transduction histidine kinase